MALSSLPLVSGVRGLHSCSSNPASFAQDPLALHATSSVERDYGGHVVGEPFLGHAPEERYGRKPARKQVVPGPCLGIDEFMHSRAAQGRREHVELEQLAAPARHAQVLLPIELQLAAGRGLEPRVGLGLPAGVERDVVPAAVVGERVVPGNRASAASMQEVFVDRLLGRAGHGGLLGNQIAVRVEAAGAIASAVVHVAAFPPISRDRVPVDAVAFADLAEIWLQPELPVHVQLAHDVPLFQSGSFPSGCLPDRKEHIHVGLIGESTLARLARLRWCGWHYPLARLAQFILALIDVPGQGSAAHGKAARRARQGAAVHRAREGRRAGLSGEVRRVEHPRGVRARARGNGPPPRQDARDQPGTPLVISSEALR